LVLTRKKTSPDGISLRPNRQVGLGGSKASGDKSTKREGTVKTVNIIKKTVSLQT